MTTHRTAKRLTGLSIALLALSACNLNGSSNPIDEAGFRQTRYQEMMRIDGFEACREEALTMDRQARGRDSKGAYITSATIMEKCVADLGGKTRGVPEAERMRLGALTTLNYLKGGDAEKARQSLGVFRANFPERDLYFSDGSSFVQTAELLLDRTENVSFGAFATMNVNSDVKNEMRRMTHWKNK